MEYRFVVAALSVSACTARGFDPETHFDRLADEVELATVPEAPESEVSTSAFAAVMDRGSIDLNASVYAWQLQQECGHGCDDELRRLADAPIWRFEGLGVASDADRLIDTENAFGRLRGAASSAAAQTGLSIGNRMELFVDGAVPWGRVMGMLITAGHYGATDYGFVVETESGKGLLDYHAIISHEGENCVHVGVVLDVDSALLIADGRPLERLEPGAARQRFQLQYGSQGIETHHLSEFIQPAFDIPRCEHVALQANPDLPWRRIAPVWASLAEAGATPYVTEWAALPERRPRQHG